jgi:hypothetical protein
MDLAARVSSMEAAVAAYWDRIRKRMRVEQPEQVQVTPADLTEQEIYALGSKLGHVVNQGHERT